MKQEDNKKIGYEFKSFKGFIIHLVVLIGIFCCLSLNSYIHDAVGSIFYALFFGLVTFVACFNYLIIKDKAIKWYYYLIIFLGSTLAFYGLLWATCLVDYRIWGLINNLAVAITSLVWIAYKSVLIFKGQDKDSEALKFIIATEISVLCFSFFGYTIQHWDSKKEENESNEIVIEQANKAFEVIRNNIKSYESNFKEIQYFNFDDESGAFEVGFYNNANEPFIYSYHFDGSAENFKDTYTNVNQVVTVISTKEVMPAFDSLLISNIEGENITIPNTSLPNDYKRLEHKGFVQYQDISGSEPIKYIAGIGEFHKGDDSIYDYCTYKYNPETHEFLQLNKLDGISYQLAIAIIESWIEA